MLAADVAPSRRALSAWTRTLVRDCRELLSVVLPLTRREHDFLSHLNDEGRIEPDLLTEDRRLRDVIAGHPGLAWKAQNVREHAGRR